MAADFPVARLVEEQPQWRREYSVVEKIGEGAYGDVYKAVHRTTGKAFALKRTRLFDGEGIPSTAIREVALIKQCSHPNVIRLYDVHSGVADLCLFFELLDMDLRVYLKKNGPFGEAPGVLGLRDATRQLLRGLCFCHGRRVMHRDLKPQNVLVDLAARPPTLKLADFGLARTYSLPSRPHSAGVVTLWYRAPEILLGLGAYGPPVDVWSMGCILAEMAAPLQDGYPQAPFQGTSEIDIIFQIFRLVGTPNEHVWPGVCALRLFSPNFPVWADTELWELRRSSPALGEDGRQLLCGLLRLNPRARISARQALQHSFLDPAAVDHAQRAFVDEF